MVRVLQADRNVADQFPLQAVAQIARRHVPSVPARHRRRVDTERHRDGRLLDAGRGGSATGARGWVIVSPIVMSLSPVRHTMSPAAARSIATRWSPSNAKSFVTRVRLHLPVEAWPPPPGRRPAPCRGRSGRSRSGPGSRSSPGWRRAVAGAAPGRPAAEGTRSAIASKSGRSVRPGCSRTGGSGSRLRVGIEHGKVDLVVARIEIDEQVVYLAQHVGGPGVPAVDLVDDHDGRQVALEGFPKHEARLGQGAFRRVDQEQHAVDHRQGPLDLAPEVGVPRGVDDVDRQFLVPHGRVLGHDRDAALALQIDVVERALRHPLVRAEDAALMQERIHEGGLAVVDVGDDGHVAQNGIGGVGHGRRSRGRTFHRTLREQPRGRAGPVADGRCRLVRPAIHVGVAVPRGPR